MPGKDDEAIISEKPDLEVWQPNKCNDEQHKTLGFLSLLSEK